MNPDWSRRHFLQDAKRPALSAANCSKAAAMIQRLFILAAILIFGLVGARAVSPSPGELTTAKEWMAETMLTDSAQQPFSFVYGGKLSSEFLHGWKSNKEARDLDKLRRQHTLIWTDAVTG